MTVRVTHAATIAALLVACCGCGSVGSLEIPTLGLEKVSDEEKIAAILNDVHAGMESKRVFKILAHVSPDYMDAEGRDYDAIRAYLSTVLKEYRDIKITRTRPRILVDGNLARVLETFGTVAEPLDPSSPTPPINLQGQVAAYLERTGSTWKIVEWGPLY